MPLGAAQPTEGAEMAPRKKTPSDTPDGSRTATAYQEPQATVDGKTQTEAYEQGYRDGYQAARAELAAKHRKPLFEHVRDTVLASPILRQLELGRPDVISLLGTIEADYGERLSTADRNLIVENALRQHKTFIARNQAGDKPRGLSPAERSRVQVEPTVTEYEVVT